MRTYYILICCFIVFSCNDDVENSLVTRYDTLSKASIDTIPPPPASKEPNASSQTNGKLRAADNEHWKKKKAEGVDFMVIGNEPFWNLEIRNGKSLRFHLSDWEQPVNIPFSGRVENSKFNEVGAKDIEVRIVPEECSDGMSDFGYDYTVTVIYKGITYKGCGIAL